MLAQLAGYYSRSMLSTLRRTYFGNGEQGALYDISERRTLFQDAAGTVPVDADSQPVGSMLDLSGNERHLSQSNAASRPLYRIVGGLHWLEFDGIDDYLWAASAPFFAVGESVFVIALRGPAQDDRRVFAEGSSDSSNPIYAPIQSGQSASGEAMKFASYIRDDTGTFGTQVEQTDGAVLAAFDDTAHILTLLDSGSSLTRRLDGDVAGGHSVAYTRPNPLTANRMALGALLRATPAVFFAGRIYGFIGVAATHDMRAAEEFMAGKSGVTLV